MPVVKDKRKLKHSPRNKKLTPEQVIAIRKDRRRPYKIIAFDYGVGISCIWDIINGKSWKDVKKYLTSEQNAAKLEERSGVSDVNE